MPRSGTEQVAALPWRRVRRGVEVLLVTSRESKRWLIPKGWQMLGLIDSNAAKREAYEEAGVGERIRRDPIGTYTYIKRTDDGARRRCRVTVYALGVLIMHASWPERRERARRWFSLGEAANQVREAKLRAIIRSFGTAR